MEKMDLEIDDFMNYCEYRNLSKKTLLSYEQSLRLFSRYLMDTYKINRSEQVTQQIIWNYINDTKKRGKYTVVANENTKKTNNPLNRGDYGKKVSMVTLNNYIRNLKVYFNYMYDNRIIKKNPTQKIKLIHVPRKAKGYMNDIEVNNLLKCFDLSRFHEYRDCVITELLFDTGMRLGECLLIKEKTDINFAERTIFLPADNTKGKKDRYVFFSVQMATELKRWLQYKDRYKESEYVFCTIKRTVLQERSFESNFSNYGERIGKKEINPHLLRNNFAKRFLMNGGDIFTLSKILGHSSIKVTEQCYLDLQTEDLKKQYEKHSPLMNLKKENKAVASN